MAGPIRIAVQTTADKAGRDIDGLAGKTSGLGGKVAKLGKAAAVGFGAVALGAGVVGKAVVGAASDAEQSLGATETVFGRFAGKVIKTSQDAATKYGLSANEYRTNANLIGSLFKGQGVALDQLGGKTQKTIGTAANLAATFGGTTKDAVEALASAYKGEFDPLERYGISLKQSDINARLAAKGQDKLTGQAAKLAKQVAASELIQKQAAQTNGAFARETDTLAHKQQVLGAQVENIKAKIGSALLPVLTTVLGFISNNLGPAFARIGQYVAPALAAFGSFAATVGANVLPVVQRFAGFIVSTVVPAVVTIAQRVAANLKPVLEQLAATFQARVLPAVQQIIAKFQQWMPTILRVAGAILNMASKIAGVVLPIIIRLAGFILGKMVPVMLTGIGVVVRIAGAFVTMGGKVADGARKFADFAGKVRDAIAKAITYVQSIPGKVKAALSGAGDLLVNAGKAIIGGLVRGIDSMIETVKGKLRALTNLIPKVKGPESRDRNLLYSAGRLIIGSLVRGFDDETPSMHKALAALTRDIETYSASPTATVKLSATDALSDIATAVDLRRQLELSLKLSAEQVSQLQRGRQVKADLAYVTGKSRR